MSRSRQSPPILRPATPVDAAFLAWGLQEASGGLFTALLGGRGLAILTKVLAEPAHALSYEHAVVAETGGLAVGMCQGYPAYPTEPNGEQFRQAIPGGTGSLVRQAGVASVRMAAVTALGWPAFAALEKHDVGDWYLQAVAVRAQVRGLGVGQALVADAFARARAADCKTLTLDVDAENARAQALYERLGLEVVRTSRRAVFLGGVQVRRMATSLCPLQE